MASGPGYFEHQAGSYAPIVGGNPYQPAYGYEGLPGSSVGGMSGQLMQVLMPQMMQMVQQRTGMMPMGLHGQNIADSLQQQRFTRLHDDLLRQASQTDKRAMMDTWRGVAAMAGTPWTADVRQSARQLSNITGTMLPSLVQTMPMLVDQLGGMRGSAAVMANYMHMGGRYRLDPVTGQMGMSTNTIKQIVNDVYERDFSNDKVTRDKANSRVYGEDWMRTQTYKADPNADPDRPAPRTVKPPSPPITYTTDTSGNLVGRTKQQVGDLGGVSAGQFGLLFDEMSRRGMVRSDDRTARERTVAAMGDVDPNSLDLMGLGAIAHKRGLQKEKGAFNLDIRKMSGEEIDVLREDPAIQTRLRQMDSKRISDQLRSYTAAISAVRDIFGDRGSPNAPMGELLAGLEAMSGGNLSQVSPARLEMMVRNTYNLSQQTGIGLDQAMAIQGHGAQMAQELGIEPIFATQAMQGNLAYGAAYRGRGLNAPHLAAWGRMNDQQVQQADMSLRMRAAASRATNQMSAALRMEEALAPTGGLTGAAGRYAKAIRMGQTEFANDQGKMISVDLDESAFRTIMGQSGVDGNTISTMLEDQFSNREFAEQNGLANLTRKLQPREMKAFAQDKIEAGIYNRVYSRLKEDGMPAERADQVARTAAEKASGSVTEALFNLSPEEKTNREARNRAMAAAMKTAFQGTEAEHLDEGFNRLTGELSYGQLDSAVRGKYRGLGGAQGMFQLMDPKTMEAADRETRRAQFTSDRQSALSGLGQGSVLRRVMTEINNSSGTNIERVVGAALGMVDNKEVKKQLEKHFIKVQKQKTELLNLEERIENTTNPQRRQELIDERHELLGEYQTELDKISTIGRDSGLFMGGAYGLDDVEAASASLDRLSEYTEDLPKFEDRAQADKFWKSREGQEYRRAVNSAMTNVDDMVQSVADTDNTGLAQRLGPEGLKQMKSMHQSQQKMRELAATYTGGDIAALVAGDFEDKYKDKIMEQVTNIRKEQVKAVEAVEQAMDKEVKPVEMNEKFKTELEGFRKEVGGGDPTTRIQRMLDVYGVTNVRSEQLRGLEESFARGDGGDFVDSAISTRQTLADYAKRKGTSTTELIKKFRGGTESETAENINAAGLPDEVREALMFQFRTGMSGLGKGATAGDVSEYLEQGYSSGAEAYGDGKGDQDQDPQGFPKEFAISGTLDITSGMVKGQAQSKWDVIVPQNV